MSERVVVLAIATVFLICSPVRAAWEVGEKGIWPKSWPPELEHLREHARSYTGGVLELSHYEIPFTKREDFEAVWPHILEVKGAGPLILLQSPDKHFLGTSTVAGVRIWSPPKFAPGEHPPVPVPGAANERERCLYTTFVELIVDGSIVDLNRIPLPSDSSIIDTRFKVTHGESDSAGKSDRAEEPTKHRGVGGNGRTAEEDPEILWGNAVGGLRLGIRPWPTARRSNRFRHGDWLRYEVWIKNDSAEAVQIARDPGTFYQPMLKNNVVNVAGGIMTVYFAFPEGDHTLSLAPAESALLTLQPLPQCPVLPVTARPGRHGGEPLRISPGEYPLFAELEVYFFSGDFPQVLRQDGKSLRLRSATRGIRVLPAARLQIRQIHELTPTRTLESVKNDPGQKIVAYGNEQLVLRRSEVILDEEDVRSVKTVSTDGNQFAVHFELHPAAASRFPRMVDSFIMPGQRDREVRLAVLLDGKVLSTVVFSPPVAGNTVPIAEGLTKETAEDLAARLRVAVGGK